MRFWQEIYDGGGRLAEIHEKYPLDKGHQKTSDTYMKITSETVAEKIAGYLHHKITLEQLVDWAECALLDGELVEHDTKAVVEVISRLGVADVRAFGLMWEDCEDLLGKLGFAPRVQVVKV